MDPTAGVPLWQPGQPKLLDRVRDRCRVRHLSLNTQHSYEAWIRRYILFHDKRHPLQMGAPEVAAFLTHLAVDRHVAASTQNQALSALLFLYREVLQQDFGWLNDVVRAKKPKRLPVVFTPEEAMAVIEQLEGVRWLMALQLYGGGLRLMECLRLRVKDLDYESLQVTVREGKGDKDRITLLSARNSSITRAARDCESGESLGRKWGRSAGRDWNGTCRARIADREPRANTIVATRCHDRP